MFKRYDELDSLRGLAALTVVLSHIMLIFPYFNENTYNEGYNSIGNILKYTPLHLIWGGHEAVILFFLLSGFVLSLAFLNENKPSYFSFIIKRIIRIYLPWIVTLLLIVLIQPFIEIRPLEGLSAWINARWKTDLSISMIFSHILLLSDFQPELNPIIWSLVHEMRISLFFPLMIGIINKGNIINSLGITISLSIIGFGLSIITGFNQSTSYFMSIHYASIFMVGAMLAKYRKPLTGFILSLNNLKFISFIVLGVVAYTFSWLFLNIGFIHNAFTHDWAITFGASIFIIIAISPNVFSKFLKLKPIRYLGKISYSLYLYHFIVLLTVLHMFPQSPIYYKLVMVLFLSVLIAKFSYNYIEKPSMIIGKKIVKMIDIKSTQQIFKKTS